MKSVVETMVDIMERKPMVAGGSKNDIPALMITFNRIEYSKRALAALLESDCTEILVVDNGSTDGTRRWLRTLKDDNLAVVFNHGKNSIATAMNAFLSMIKKDKYEYCVKVDNDTIVPKDFCARMLPHMKFADIVQAKHHIIPATDPGGWYGFTNSMKRENGLLYNHFIGGSGIMIRRSVVDKVPETGEPLGGWRHFQRLHPELRKAFCEDVSIELLDTHENGTDYSMYPEYYKSTGRL